MFVGDPVALETHMYTQTHTQAYTGNTTGGSERFIKRAINQKVAGSIPGHAKLCYVLGQGASPYLPLGVSLYLP